MVENMGNKKSVTLLRYPGGKAKIYPVVKKIIVDNNLSNRIYVEPFAGGFGLGVKLMINHDIGKFIINDLDYHIYSFWFCVFFKTKDLISKINQTDISLTEWKKQKNIYDKYQKYDIVDVGFSTLFLNRTNFSGILKAGPLGGKSQEGKYKIDCRFNKKAIIDSISLVSKFRDNVEVMNLDVKELLIALKPRESDLFYNFDPPYVEKGSELYSNSFSTSDHNELKDAVDKIDTEWIMTYDNVELIMNLYKFYKKSLFPLQYSASGKRLENEIMIYHL